MSGLLELRPDASKAAGMFHLYYVKQMPNNGIYFPEAIFVKDTAALETPGTLAAASWRRLNAS